MTSKRESLQNIKNFAETIKNGIEVSKRILSNSHTTISSETYLIGSTKLGFYIGREVDGKLSVTTHHWKAVLYSKTSAEVAAKSLKVGDETLEPIHMRDAAKAYIESSEPILEHVLGWIKTAESSDS